MVSVSLGAWGTLYAVRTGMLEVSSASAAHNEICAMSALGAATAPIMEAGFAPADNLNEETFKPKFGWPSWRTLRQLDIPGASTDYELAAHRTDIAARHVAKERAHEGLDEAATSTSMCAHSVMMDAAHALHAKYFKVQQTTEREFLSSLDSKLCGTPHAATD